MASSNARSECLWYELKMCRLLKLWWNCCYIEERRYLGSSLSFSQLCAGYSGPSLLPVKWEEICSMIWKLHIYSLSSEAKPGWYSTILSMPIKSEQQLIWFLNQWLQTGGLVFCFSGLRHTLEFLIKSKPFLSFTKCHHSHKSASSLSSLQSASDDHDLCPLLVIPTILYAHLCL